MGQPLIPNCTSCGQMLARMTGIGLYCPNVNCGAADPLDAEPFQTLAPDPGPFSELPPAGARLVKVADESVVFVMEKELQKNLAEYKQDEVIGLYGVQADGVARRLTGIMLEVRRMAEPDQLPATTRGHLRLATRDGVTL